MSGNNISLALPPGIQSDVSRYMAKARWWDGNLVRWGENGVMGPVGGWQTLYTIAGLTQPIREMFSWRDNNYIAYAAFGTLNKAIVKRISDVVEFDVTPSDLVVTSTVAIGYGSAQFGSGRFGLDSANAPGGGVESKFDEGYWTFYNWGQDLIAVHATDGRLFTWSPSDTAVKLIPVTNAPIGNRLCITTDERHAMVMGGKGNPRRIKWSSRENLDIWAAAAENSAGGFELDTRGIILNAIKVPQGILVLTDIDVHLVEYIGPPFYYSRRLITDETGTISPKAAAPLPNGALFVGQHSFWRFNGGIVRQPCSVAINVFHEGVFSSPLSCFMGVNEAMQEVWFFYPGVGEVEASRYVNYRFSTEMQWWSKGNVGRTAWLNPIWNTLPLAAAGSVIYEHERGWTADGAPRNDVFAETGALEIQSGDNLMAVDKIFHDRVRKEETVAGSPLPYNAEFLLARTPEGPETVYGPVTLNPTAGATSLRFKARQVALRVKQIADVEWSVGEQRLRVKAVGKRVGQNV